MKNINDLVVIVEARKDSVRVKNKMLRPFVNSCLFEIAVQKILTSKVISKDNFYVSVMDPEFIEIANKYGVNIYNRSPESCVEPIELQAVKEWHQKLGNQFKYWITVNACNPILSINTIDNFIKFFLKSDSDGMFGVFEKKTFLFDSSHKMLNKFYAEEKYLKTLETKFVETTYEAAHSLYAGKISDISKGIYMGSFQKRGDPEFFIMDEIEAFDIDWPWQFDMAEVIYQQEFPSLKQWIVKE